jgi:uncharacterized protein YggE
MSPRGRLLAVLLVVTAATAAAPAARAQDAPLGPPRGTPPRAQIVETIGEGVVRAVPDEAILSLGVTTEAPTAREAMDDNARRMTAVVQALAAAGFTAPDVSTRAVQLQPVHDHRPNAPPRIVAYRATNLVHVRTDRPATIGQALDAAVQAGANVAASLTFALRDPQAAHVAALEQAVQDARRRATAMAGARGATLRRIVEVKSVDLGMPEPRPVEMLRAGLAAAPPTPVEVGDITVRARVVLRAEFR